MAIGEAFREAGGKNESATIGNMINDMTREGKIYADGELFYENGKIQRRNLKEILRKRKYRKVTENEYFL